MLIKHRNYGIKKTINKTNKNFQKFKIQIIYK